MHPNAFLLFQSNLEYLASRDALPDMNHQNRHLRRTDEAVAAAAILAASATQAAGPSAAAYLPAQAAAAAAAVAALPQQSGSGGAVSTSSAAVSVPGLATLQQIMMSQGAPANVVVANRLIMQSIQEQQQKASTMYAGQDMRCPTTELYQVRPHDTFHFKHYQLREPVSGTDERLALTAEYRVLLCPPYRFCQSQEGKLG